MSEQLVVARSRDAQERAIALFAAALWGDIGPDVEVEVRGLRGGRPVSGYRAVTDVGALTRLALMLDAQGADVYVGVAPRRRGSRSGGGASVARLVAVVADVDCVKHGIDRDEAEAAAHRAPWGAPTIAVWSGRGWHFYWLYLLALEADDPRHAAACAAARAHFNRALGVECADSIGDAARILRLPGTTNHKPDGGDVVLSVIAAHRRVDVDALVAHAPEPARVAARGGIARPPVDLPTEVPAYIAAAIERAGVGVAKVCRAPAGGITALELTRCPACGGEDRQCYVVPLSGTLRSFRAQKCPAGMASGTRRDGGPVGLLFDEWATPAPRLLAGTSPTNAITLEAADGGLTEAFVAEMIAMAGPVRWPVAAVPPGVGKTRAALAVAGAQALRGRAVIYVTLTHELAEEAAAMGAAVQPFARFVHKRGAVSACRLLWTADAEGDEQVASSLRVGHERGRADGPCGLRYPAESRHRCAVQDCEGREPVFAEVGEVTCVARIDGVHVRAGGELAPLVIYDERPEPLVERRASTVDVLRLSAGGSREAVVWATAWPSLAGLAAGVAAIARAEAARVGAIDYPRRVHGAWLASALHPLAGAIEEASRVDLDAAAAEAGARPGDARLGHARHYPSRDAVLLVAAVVRGELAGIELVIEPDGTTRWEMLRPALRPPPEWDVIGLDGTAGLTPLRWAALAGGREVVMRQLHVEAREPLAATWLRTKALRAGALWNRKTGRWYARAVSAILRPLERVVADSRARRGQPGAHVDVAVIARQRVADVIRAGGDEPLAPARLARVERDGVATVLAEQVVRLGEDGAALLPGHWHQADRGSNRFEHVDALVILGTPRDDLGAMQAQARLLDVDADAWCNERVAADIAQAAARARHVRRRGRDLVLVYAGDAEPPTGGELPGVTWRVEDVAQRARRDEHAVRASARVAIVALAREMGCLPVAAVLGRLAERFGHLLVRSEVAVLARRWGWTRHVVARCYVVFAETAAEATRLFSGLFSADGAQGGGGRNDDVCYDIEEARADTRERNRHHRCAGRGLEHDPVGGTCNAVASTVAARPGTRAAPAESAAAPPRAPRPGAPGPRAAPLPRPGSGGRCAPCAWRCGAACTWSRDGCGGVETTGPPRGERTPPQGGER